MRPARWGLVAMLAAAVAAGGAGNAIDDAYLARGWHPVVRGEEGGDVGVGPFQVHVHGATSSAQLEDRDLLTSPATFVAVDVSYATTDAWATPEEVLLVDADGREFVPPSGFGRDGTPWAAGPDIWLRGALLFEVPPESLDGLALEFRPELPDARRPATTLRVPLTVTTSSEPLRLEPAAVLAEGQR